MLPLLNFCIVEAMGASEADEVEALGTHPDRAALAMTALKSCQFLMGE